MRRILIASLLALSLAGCGAQTLTETRVETVAVPVRAPCPDPETMEAVNSARPVPLRDWPAAERPVDEAGRLAAERAQLGRYEAPNAWADQVQAVLDRCFNPVG